MSAHTPGPWAVAGLPHGTVVRTQSLKKSAFGADRYAAIGGFDRSDREQLAEAMANARLIAAAPELLAALREIIEWHGGEISDSELVESARIAITKATGGAS